jgi:hypothetical protein
MRTAPIALALTASLVACQGSGAVPSANAGLAGTSRSIARNYEVCGERGFSALDSGGGVQKIPHITDQKQLMGDFGYAAIDGGGTVQGLVFSCPTSDPIAPIPQGYAPDWFGSWTLSCSQGGCPGVSFANGHLRGHIVSNAWVASRTYYLYLYQDYARQYIESYQVGPVKTAGNGNSSLDFDSPFENGLAYPENDGYSLEIVHPSSER